MKFIFRYLQKSYFSFGPITAYLRSPTTYCGIGKSPPRSGLLRSPRSQPQQAEFIVNARPSNGIERLRCGSMRGEI